MLKKILIAVGCVVIALGAAYGGYELGIWRFNYPDIGQYPVRGIDVSHHQGQIDWQAVRDSGIQFAYIKATEGEDFRDPQFSKNWREAQSSGIVRGAYHYFTFRTSGRDQALNFIAAVPRDENALPPVVDFEFAGNSQRLPRAKLLEGLKAFLDTVGDYYGQRPILYVTKESFAEYLEGEDWAYPIWLRDIFGEPGPVGGRPWVIWQYADNVRIPGIKGPVDQNALRGTIRDLLQSTRVFQADDWLRSVPGAVHSHASSLDSIEMFPYRIVYRRDDAVVTVVRLWRSERLMDPGPEGNA